MKKNVFITCLLCSVVLMGYIYTTWRLSDNYKLDMNEIKAYFKTTVHLDYQPDIEKIKEIQIGGTFSTFYKAVYTDKIYIEEITHYLNNLELVKANADELPNKSPDSYVQYYDNDETLVGNFVIYGEVFIKDVNHQQLYRIKTTHEGIVEGIEKLLYNI